VAQAQKACRAPPFSLLRKFLNGRHSTLIFWIREKRDDLNFKTTHILPRSSVASISFCVWARRVSSCLTEKSQSSLI